MSKVLTGLLFVLLTSSQLKSQVLPHEASVLNYRLIGFSFPKNRQANLYKIEIATGTYFSEDSFKKNIVKTIDASTNKIIGEVPSFGSQYTWRVLSKGDNAAARKTFRHFSTGNADGVDTSVMHLRILKNGGQYKNAYVFIDAAKALYDMSGRPVWFLPENAEFNLQNSDMRDMKISPQSTITMLGLYNVFELDYNGKILWRGPNNGKVSGDTVEHYHHEFTRLTNGHYMVMGFKNVPVYLKASASNRGIDTSLYIGTVDKMTPEYTELYHAYPFGTVIEYDEHGNVAWSYCTASYFSGSDMINHVSPRGRRVDLKVHDNAFYFDEKNRAVYMSLKDISRVIKVKYPEGYTLNTYGKIFKKEDIDQYKPGGLQAGNGMFCGQHCCRCSRQGYLYLFDNNFCNQGALPKIVMMQQPAFAGDTLKKIWEYECQLEDGDKELQSKLNFGSGGNVEELPDGALLATMSSGYSKVFIVNMKKEILWSAMAEKWNSYEKKWEKISLYRASMITSQEQLERLVWNQETKQ